jgi:DNA-binding protein H-NS
MAEHDPPNTPDLWAAAPPTVLSRRERAAVLARIEALMEYWGITVDDLLAPTVSPDVAVAPPGPLPVKYRHPVSGETWDGQGPHPEWLRRALLKEGLRVDELKPAPAAPPAPTSEAD